MRKIILDTNFLMAVGQNRIDIVGEFERICDFQYELYYVDKTETELEKIGDRDSRIAMEFIRKKEIGRITTESDDYVDDLLISLGEEYIIATQDKELRKRLKNNDIPYIYIRQRKYLMIEGL